MTRTTTIGSTLAIAGLCAAGLAVTSSAHAIPTTLIYINDSAGAIYAYDAANAYSETLVAAAATTRAFSMSSGPAANTLYIQQDDGDLLTYNVVTHATTYIGGNVLGNAFGEGRDGSLYSGTQFGGFYKVNPSNGVSMAAGGSPYGYAGDLAVDPTDLGSMYAAISYSNAVALARVDKSNGMHTIIGSFGLGSGASIFGLGFSLDSTLYATGPTAAGGGIYTVDKTTGAALHVRSLSYTPYDMATQPFDVSESEVPVTQAPPAQVPEPAPLALTAVGLLALALRKRARGAPRSG